MCEEAQMSHVIYCLFINFLIRYFISILNHILLRLCFTHFLFSVEIKFQNKFNPLTCFMYLLNFFNCNIKKIFKSNIL